jgi:ADP-heptose:LPS heptosyltransferase
MTGRVLIHRPGSLGDTVVALPCLKLIRRSFPDAEVRVLTNAPVASSAPPLAAVLDGMGLIDGCLEYPIGVRDVPRLWRLARAIRRWRPDILVYLARRETLGQVRRDAFFFRTCGIRRIIGLPLTRDLLKSRAGDGGMFEPEAERLARNMAPLGPIDFADRSIWDLRLTEADRARPRRLIAEHVGASPFIAVSLGTKQLPNDWGIDNWRTLCAELCLTYPHSLVFTGAEEDRGRSDAVMGGLGGRAINLCGLNVRENAALIAAASLFVGHDSGPMHLAGAVGTPVVAVFSRLFPPGMWYPLGTRSNIVYPPGDSVLSVAPPAVLAAIREILPPDAAPAKLAAEP